MDGWWGNVAKEWRAMVDRQTSEKRAKFIGRFTNRIDSKSRTFIPAKLKPLIYARWGHKPDLMLAVMGFDRCLVLVEREEWFRNRARLEELDWMDADVARLRRLSSLSEECALDSQERITIPQFLRKFAKLDGEVMFVGCEEYLELWNPALAEQDFETLLSDAGKLIDRVRGRKEAVGAEETGNDCEEE